MPDEAAIAEHWYQEAMRLTKEVEHWKNKSARLRKAVQVMAADLKANGLQNRSEKRS